MKDVVELLDGIAAKLRLLDTLTNKLMAVRHGHESGCDNVLDRVIRQALKVTCQNCGGCGRYWDARCLKCGGTGDRLYDPGVPPTPDPPPSNIDTAILTCRKLCSILDVRLKLVVEVDRHGDTVYRFGTEGHDGNKPKHHVWSHQRFRFSDAVMDFQSKLIEAVRSEAASQLDFARFCAKDCEQKHNHLLAELERIIVLPVMEG